MPRPPPTTITGACRCRSRAAGQREIRRVRDRHEPCRRDHAADQAGAPARRDRHHHRAGASGIFRFARKDRRRQGGDFSQASSRAAPPCSTATIAQYARLAAAAKAAGVARVVSFGEHEKADARLVRVFAACRNARRVAGAASSAQDVTYKLGAPGKHLVLNSLAVLAAASLVGADLALAALALNNLKPAAGRGTRVDLAGAGRQRAADRRELQRQPGLDGARPSRCSARPRSARKAAASPCSATCWNWAAQGVALHRGLAGPIEAANVDLVFC